MRRAGLGTLIPVILGVCLVPAIAAGGQASHPTPLAVNSRAPVAPVLSPPLRDVKPMTSTGVDNQTVRNRERPHPAVTMNGPSRPDPVVQRAFGITAPTPTGVNFEGIGANGFAPPDSDGTVGPSHYIQWINVMFAVYDKSGTKLYGPALGNTLFSGLGASSPCVTHNDGDPIVVYDQLADRWVGTQFVVGAAPDFSHQCVAISTTGDPLGSYYLYDFVTDSANFVDYPHFGVWPDSYYMTAHIFNAAGSAYVGQGVYAFERSKMLAGLPARVVGDNLGNVFFGALPTTLDGLNPPPAASANYVIAPGAPEWDGSASDVLHVWNATASWSGTPALNVTGPTDVATDPFNSDLCNFSRNCVPQPDPTNGVDAIPGRFMWRLAYRNDGTNESLLLNHTVNVAAASGHAANQAGVRWYEVRTPTSPAIYQQGTFAPDTDWRWMGSIAMDNSGDIALGYSKSSSSLFPEIDITGRLSGDPLGTMGSEIVMKAGLGSQNGGLTRWGDYSAMTVDPRDGCTFWYTNQYQPADGLFNWATRIGSFRFPSCTSPARATITGTVYETTTLLPIQHALVTTDSGFSGSTDIAGRYTIVLPPGSYNVVASADQRNCTPSSSQPVTVGDGATATVNFGLTGNPLIDLQHPIVDDSVGNGNGVINRNECFVLDLPLKNNGCATETGVSAVLTTSTAGVTILQGTSAYGNMRESDSAINLVPFKAATEPGFVCGTDIAFTLTVNSDQGTTVLHFTEPTCAAAPAIRNGSITNSDSTETSRMGRNGLASDCSGKACPGALGTGTRHYDSYSFTNTAPGPRCIKATLTPSCLPASDGNVFSVAYLTSFDAVNLCTNYIGDIGTSPLDGSSGSYEFTVPSGDTFIVIVNESTAGAGCTNYSLSIEGLIDDTDAGRPAPPTAGNDGPLCAGDTLHLTATTIPSATYSWTGPNGFTSTQQNPTIAGVTTAASGTYTVIATVGGCDTDPATTNVTVHPVPPSPTAGSNSPVAAGGTLNLTASAVPGATYLWTGPNGFTSSSQNPSISSVTAAAAGVYSVTATVSGCTSPAGTTTVVINDLTPVGLAIDEVFGPGNHNGVFEPGETVSMNPRWKNNGSANIAFTGALSNFTGPAGPTYTKADASADYGTLASGASTDCGVATGDCYALGVTGTRPAAHWDATVDETLSEGAVKTWTIHIGNSFSDVLTSNPFYRFIETLFHKGVTAGCAAGMYCPGNNVLRQQMAVFLLISKEGAGYTPPACTSPMFADVPCSSPYAAWINELANRSVTSGCGGGNFCPTDPVTRAQMSVFLLRTLEGPSYTPPACTTPIFGDVPCSNPFAAWIDEIAIRGITGGCGGGNFCPSSSVTRGQMAVFLTTTFGLKLYGP